jgi:ribokinase
MGIVVVLGSIIVDLVARAPRFPLPGEVVIGEDFDTFLGGKGINQAIAAARLGARVTMIGRVGTDDFGDAFFPILAQEGIDSTYVTRDDHVGTGVSSLIVATGSGQNMIVVNQRANLAVTVESVEVALQAASQAHAAEADLPMVFLAQCETSRASYVAGLRRARSMGMITMLNAAPVPAESLDDVLPFVDILIVNETEAAALARIDVNAPEMAQVAAERLLALGPKYNITTLGAHGALWSVREEGASISHHPLRPFKVKALDTTAAGDAFCGALAASLALGRALPAALRRASAAGAVTTTRKGAIVSLPTAAEVEALLDSAEQG